MMYRQLVVDEWGGSHPGASAAVLAIPRPRTESPTAGAPDPSPRTSTVAESLTAVLASEDAAEETGTLSPFERVTCRVHHRWIHQCVHSPLHVIPVTGHRWCTRCQTAAGIAVDELTWTVTVSCPRCRRTPPGLATRQLVRSCQASLAAAATGADRPPRA